MCADVVFLCENVFSYTLESSPPPLLEPDSGAWEWSKGIFLRILTDSLTVRVFFLCCCDRRSDGGKNGDRCRYVAGSNRTQPISIRLPPAPGPREGGKMGSGGGHEQHTSSPGLHGGRLPLSDTGIHAPQAS